MASVTSWLQSRLEVVLGGGPAAGQKKSKQERAQERAFGNKSVYVISVVPELRLMVVRDTTHSIALFFEAGTFTDAAILQLKNELSENRVAVLKLKRLYFSTLTQTCGSRALDELQACGVTSPFALICSMGKISYYTENAEIRGAKVVDLNNSDSILDILSQTSYEDIVQCLMDAQDVNCKRQGSQRRLPDVEGIVPPIPVMGATPLSFQLVEISEEQKLLLDELERRGASHHSDTVRFYAEHLPDAFLTIKTPVQTESDVTITASTAAVVAPKAPSVPPAALANAPIPTRAPATSAPVSEQPAASAASAASAAPASQTIGGLEELALLERSHKFFSALAGKPSALAHSAGWRKVPKKVNAIGFLPFYTFMKENVAIMKAKEPSASWTEVKLSRHAEDCIAILADIIYTMGMEKTLKTVQRFLVNNESAEANNKIDLFPYIVDYFETKRLRADRAFAKQLMKRASFTKSIPAELERPIDHPTRRGRPGDDARLYEYGYFLQYIPDRLEVLIALGNLGAVAVTKEEIFHLLLLSESSPASTEAHAPTQAAAATGTASASDSALETVTEPTVSTTMQLGAQSSEGMEDPGVMDSDIISIDEEQVIPERPQKNKRKSIDTAMTRTPKSSDKRRAVDNGGIPEARREVPVIARPPMSPSPIPLRDIPRSITGPIGFEAQYRRGGTSPLVALAKFDMIRKPINLFNRPRPNVYANEPEPETPIVTAPLRPPLVSSFRVNNFSGYQAMPSQGVRYVDEPRSSRREVIYNRGNSGLSSSRNIVSSIESNSRYVVNNNYSSRGISSTSSYNNYDTSNNMGGVSNFNRNVGYNSRLGNNLDNNFKEVVTPGVRVSSILARISAANSNQSSSSYI